jgi:hypothetical protein
LAEISAEMRYLCNIFTGNVIFKVLEIRTSLPSLSANIEDRIFNKHGRWKSDRAKDGYVKENIQKRLSVPKHLVI